MNKVITPLQERTVAGLHASLMDKLPFLNQNAPILDVGCGTGAWLERLAGRGFDNLCGLDADIEQVRFSKAKVLKVNIDNEGDFCLGGRRFGLVTAIEVIEHLENPGHLIQLVNNHLDDNGYFLLTTPNIHSVLCRFRFMITGNLKQFDSKGDQTHIYPVLLTALDRILTRYNLVIRKKWSYPEDGSSITSGKPLKMAAAILEIVLPNAVPGDILCLLIQKKSDRGMLFSKIR